MNIHCMQARKDNLAKALRAAADKLDKTNVTDVAFEFRASAGERFIVGVESIEGMSADACKFDPMELDVSIRWLCD